MRTTAGSRAVIACVALAACFTVYSFRLVYLQVAKHEEYAALAGEKHGMRVAITSRRGAILDVKGEPLAQNEPVRKVVADAGVIGEGNLDRAASLLAGPLEMSEGAIRKKLSLQVQSKRLRKLVPAPYIVLKKDVPEDAAKRIADSFAVAKIRGMTLERDSVRVYPNGRRACHIIGYPDADGRGVEGIERNMDQYLRGEDGFRYIERDAMGRELVQFRGMEVEARNGSDVRLTIDMALQDIVESELQSACRVFRPKSATVILLNPKNGEILALANSPNYDINFKGEAKPEERRNRAITDTVEPGSTFKNVVVSAVLDRRLLDNDSLVNCEGGYYSEFKLHDHKPYWELSVHDILKFSSNIGAAKLALRLGDQSFYGYVRNFGFGERSGVNLPGEVSGLVHPPHTWTKLSISRLAMGHEVSATPLQIAMAMSVIANGGELMMPQIVKDVTDPSGKVVANFSSQPVRRVVRQAATLTVRNALMDVCTPKGTASLARVFGYKVAGKTGTAQKYDEKTRLPSHDKYVVSFVGFMPADDPAFVGLVLFDEARTPSGENYGGKVAAPVFSRIAERAARYLGLTPTEVKPQGEKGGTWASQTVNFRDQ